MVSQLIATVSSLSSYFAGPLLIFHHCLFHVKPLYKLGPVVQTKKHFDKSLDIMLIVCMKKKKQDKNLKLSPFRVKM